MVGFHVWFCRREGFVRISFRFLAIPAFVAFQETEKFENRRRAGSEAGDDSDGGFVDVRLRREEKERQARQANVQCAMKLACYMIAIPVGFVAACLAFLCMESVGHIATESASDALGDCEVDTASRSRRNPSSW